MAFETIDIIRNTSGKSSQLIEIPENLKIDDDKVYLKKVGNTIYVIPFHNPWQSLLESVDNFTEDFMSDRDQPVQQQREFFS